MSQREVKVEALILGGGIAGLWTLARLLGEGRSALLLEEAALGAGQTIASQGIIHGGVKYALGGVVGDASSAIAGMPAIWRARLAGEGEVDLRRVRTLSERQWLWTRRAVGSRLAGLVASKTIRAGVEPIPADERPEAFAGAPPGVDVYAVAEPVLEPRSLVEALAAPRERLCLRVEPGSVEFGGSGGRIDAVRCRLGSLDVHVAPTLVVLAAGAGNEALLQRGAAALGSDVDRPAPAMQRRPLHMVMARERSQGVLPEMYAHAVGLASGPLVTVTSQRDATGRTVWWIGGGVAESGVHRSASAQVDEARREMESLAPWIDWPRTEWATMRIDRAERRTESGRRPEQPSVEAWSGMAVCWPSKLAFAPVVADEVCAMLRRVAPSHERVAPSADPIPGAPGAPTARLPWEREDLEWT